jgi:hypothetical protein
MKTYLLLSLALFSMLYMSCENSKDETVEFKYEHLIKRYITQNGDVDTVYYYYDINNNLLKRVHYKFDGYDDSVISYVIKGDDYYKIDEEYFYFDSKGKIVKTSSFGSEEIFIYSVEGNLEKTTQGSQNYTTYVYDNNILVEDTTVYPIENGHVTVITQYEFCDSLNHNLNFDNNGLQQYGLKPEKLIKSQIVNTKDNSGTIINNTGVYKMYYTYSANEITIDYKTFENNVEVEQFRMQKRTIQIK